MGSLGWPEILMILVIALIVFGPRKLPELGKSLGNAIGQFKRASEDFKRTWEEEVESEKRQISSALDTSMNYTGSGTYDPGQTVQQHQAADAPVEPSSKGESTETSESRQDWA